MSHLYVVRVFIRCCVRRPAPGARRPRLKVGLLPLRMLHIVASSPRCAAEAAHWRTIGWRCAGKLGAVYAPSVRADDRVAIGGSLQRSRAFSSWHGVRFDFESVNKVAKLYYAVSPALGCSAVAVRGGEKVVDFFARTRRRRLHARLRFVSPN